jgi:hypothetical protein
VGIPTIIGVIGLFIGWIKDGEFFPDGIMNGYIWGASSFVIIALIMAISYLI